MYWWVTSVMPPTAHSDISVLFLQCFANRHSKEYPLGYFFATLPNVFYSNKRFSSLIVSLWHRQMVTYFTVLFVLITVQTECSTLLRPNYGSLWNIDTIFTEVRCWHLTARQQESRRGYRWQQSWRTSKRKRSLLCLLPVDGVIQLLHLLISEDTISEVRLELLQGQLPVVWKEINPWKLHLTEAWEVLSP